MGQNSSKSSNFECQSKILHTSKKSDGNDEEERIRYSIFAKNADDFVTKYDDYPEVETLLDNLSLGQKLSRNGPCLGARLGPNREYVWISYEDLLERARNFGSGLMSLGLEAGQNSFIGIYSQNRIEWDISMFASMFHSVIIVPLYDTLGSEAVSFIVNQADIQLIICDNSVRLCKLVKNLAKLPKLKTIVCMDRPDEDAVNNNYVDGQVQRVKIFYFNDVEKMGQKNPTPENKPKSTDLFMISYTSGSTGNPKGVMFSHENAICQIACLKKMWKSYDFDLRPGETAISYTPMAHVLGQLVHHLCYGSGVKIGIFGGDVSKLRDDMRVLKPQFMPAVPRILNRWREKDLQSLQNGPLEKAMFNLAWRAKNANLQRGVCGRPTVWDKTLFKKFQDELGGKMRFIIVGSAPILPEVKQFCSIVYGVVVIEAYGQTENVGALTMTLPNDPSPGHVGALLPYCHVKLVDVPELEYFSKEDAGEICIKGPHGIMKGYFKEPEKTAEAIDADGWLHTGDIGRWTPRGTLQIVDRKKNILKLAQGEYVAPEKIETVYCSSPIVDQIYVDGSSLRNFLVAIVVPNLEELKRQMQADSQQTVVLDNDLEKFLSDPQTEQYFLSHLQKLGKECGLNSLEQIKALKLWAEEFTLANGLLTPTMKFKRPQLRKKFANIIEEIYANFE
uniref:long-chain-fatty-acid--CoA ligase n=1 Tax=Romanomermis culicivorax TaxID=13658 RepID=A0A915IBE6_ROMCU